MWAPVGVGKDLDSSWGGTETTKELFSRGGTVIEMIGDVTAISALETGTEMSFSVL